MVLASVANFEVCGVKLLGYRATLLIRISSSNPGKYSVVASAAAPMPNAPVLVVGAAVFVNVLFRIPSTNMRVAFELSRVTAIWCQTFRSAVTPLHWTNQSPPTWVYAQANWCGGLVPQSALPPSTYT